jgi:serine/threonine-protein kinase
MEEAIPELERAAALDPRDVQLQRETGSTFVYLRRYAEANAAFERALALVPEDYEAQGYRVSTALMSGDLDGAAKVLAAVPADVDPEGAISLARWQLAMARRQPDAALAAAEHAPAWVLNNWPSSREPIALLRAQALLLKGETGLAREAFLEAKRNLEGMLSNLRALADTQSYLGLAYAGLGEKEEALAWARRATETLPVSRDMMVGGFYLTQLAMTEAQVGENQSALDHIEKLLTLPAGHAISRASLRLDPIWDPLRNDPRFQKLSQGQP